MLSMIIRERRGALDKCVCGEEKQDKEEGADKCVNVGEVIEGDGTLNRH